MVTRVLTVQVYISSTDYESEEDVVNFLKDMSDTSSEDGSMTIDYIEVDEVEIEENAEDDDLDYPSDYPDDEDFNFDDPEYDEEDNDDMFNL